MEKKISQTCPMYLTTLMLAPGLWQWPEQTAVGREGRRLIIRTIQVPAETRGEVQVGKGATDEGRRRTPKPPTSLTFSEKLLLT